MATATIVNEAHLLCDENSPQEGISDLFINDTATTEIYTLSLHDALPISRRRRDGRHRTGRPHHGAVRCALQRISVRPAVGDRKSTRLNSSHLGISYAVFCLKKKIRWRADFRWRRVAGWAERHGCVGRCE